MVFIVENSLTPKKFDGWLFGNGFGSNNGYGYGDGCDNGTGTNDGCGFGYGSELTTLAD
jgi:hypothetical protein